MPNHIQNRLTFFGSMDRIQIALALIRPEEGEGKIDFNKIVPMPESLNIQIHSGIEKAIEIALKMPLHKNPLIASLQSLNRDDFESPLQFSDEEFEMYIQGLQNVRKYGFYSWYEWSVKNWGTKSNAYQTPDELDTEKCIYFQTAWTAPIDLIGKLSAMLPGPEIELMYADEDSGSNTGRISFCNGKIVKAYQPESQSKEGYDIYFELHPEALNDYKLVDGKYEYVEE